MKKVLVTLGNEHYFDQLKQLFSSVYYNAGWDGDYLLIAYKMSKKSKKWFTDRGIIVKEYPDFYHEQVGINHILVFSKLYIFSEEFKKWDRVIFLDADIIVRGSLDNMLDIKGFGAVRIMNNYRTDLLGQFYRYTPVRLAELKSKFDVSTPAFNSGVVVVNTKIIKKGILADFLKIIEEYKDIICISEESVVNIYFYKKWEELSPIYNVCPNWELAFRKCKPEELKGVILHAYSCLVPFYRKQWDINSPMRFEWEYNLKRAESMNVKKSHLQKKIITRKMEQEDGQFILNLPKRNPFVLKEMKIKGYFYARYVIGRMFIQKHTEGRIIFLKDQAKNYFAKVYSFLGNTKRR